MFLAPLLLGCHRHDTPPDEHEASSDPCAGLPALVPAPEGFEPVLGEGALVVLGEVCTGEPVFRWEVSSAPAGSAVSTEDLVTYQDADHAECLLEPDVPGTYVLYVAVFDEEGGSSYSFVAISVAGNDWPVADCDDGSGVVGETTTLDGSDSYDPEGADLAYIWAFAEVPAGSEATDGDITQSTLMTASFVPDVAGDYVVELTVNDGVQDSEPDTCVISAS